MAKNYPVRFQLVGTSLEISVQKMAGKYKATAYNDGAQIVGSGKPLELTASTLDGARNRIIRYLEETMGDVGRGHQPEWRRIGN